MWRIWTKADGLFGSSPQWKQLMQIVDQTWLNLVTWTCGSWSVGQHDLYFLGQWFCLISWRLFDVCASYFRSMNQYDPTFDLKIKVGHCDLYFMVQWLFLIPWRLCMNIIIWDYESVWPDAWPQNKCRTLDNGSVWHKDWPLKIYVGQWPIFHHPLILPFITVIDLNYLYTLRNGPGRGYSCPSGHLL